MPSNVVGRRVSTSTQARNGDRVGLQAKVEARHTEDSLPKTLDSLGATSRNLRFHGSAMQACSNGRHVVWPIGLGRREPIQALVKRDDESVYLRGKLVDSLRRESNFQHPPMRGVANGESIDQASALLA